MSERQEGSGAFVPFGDALEAEFGAKHVFRGQGGEEVLEALEARLSLDQTWNQSCLQEAGEEGLEFEAGGVEVGAFSVLAHSGDGLKVFQMPQALTGGAFADVQAGGDFLHRKGMFRCKKKAKDGAVRGRIAEDGGELGEEGNVFVFQGQLAWGVVFGGEGHRGEGS